MSELDDLLKAHAKKSQEEAERQSKKFEEAATRYADQSQTITEKIVPVLEDIAKRLEASGGKASVQSTSGRSPGVELHFTSLGGTGRSTLTFSCHQDGSVSTSRTITWRGGSDSGLPIPSSPEVALDDADTEWVEGKVLNFVREVLDKN